MCLRFVRFDLRSVPFVREEGETNEDGVQLNSYLLTNNLLVYNKQFAKRVVKKKNR
ncbi:hypothetical protein MNBD_DELTA03-773 [hydrothermal vent metagenome]|uniref:Uncharacterized protein n=1 Tax=hydrothermal vent metagenome TaxID=652676 RepID=A0A3B0VAF6_9ZZZZ